MASGSTRRAYAKQVVEWVIDSFAVGLDVVREDLTDSRSILSLIGPGADAVLDTAPPDTEHAHVPGVHGIYVRTDLGVDVITADADAARAAFAVEEVSHDVAEVLRVERGRPRLGLEMNDTTIPQEAGLNERAVDFEKGCYVGQETVARLFYKGKPNRHLRGLRLTEPADRGAPIVARREGGRRPSARPWSPPRSGRSPSRSCARRPAPAPRCWSAARPPPWSIFRSPTDARACGALADFRSCGGRPQLCLDSRSP